MSFEGFPSVNAVCRTAKSFRAYYRNFISEAVGIRTEEHITSSARLASRVGKPVEPDGSVQSVGMYPN